MNPELRKDIQFVLSRLIELNQEPTAENVHRAIRGTLPGREGFYPLEQS